MSTPVNQAYNELSNNTKELIRKAHQFIVFRNNNILNNAVPLVYYKDLSNKLDQIADNLDYINKAFEEELIYANLWSTSDTLVILPFLPAYRVNFNYIVLPEFTQYLRTKPQCSLLCDIVTMPTPRIQYYGFDMLPINN